MLHGAKLKLQILLLTGLFLELKYKHDQKSKIRLLSKKCV